MSELKVLLVLQALPVQRDQLVLLGRRERKEMSELKAQRVLQVLQGQQDQLVLQGQLELMEKLQYLQLVMYPLVLQEQMLK